MELTGDEGEPCKLDTVKILDIYLSFELIFATVFSLCVLPALFPIEILVYHDDDDVTI